MREGGGRDEGWGVEGDRRETGRKGDRKGDREEGRQGGRETGRRDTGRAGGEREAVLGVRGERGC